MPACLLLIIYNVQDDLDQPDGSWSYNPVRRQDHVVKLVFGSQIQNAFEHDFEMKRHISCLWPKKWKK